MEIIRNCSHYSSIQTAIELNAEGSPEKVIKTAFNEDGAMAIKKEYEGIVWYEKRRPSDRSPVIRYYNYKGRASRIELKYKNGKCGNLRLPIAKNHKKIYNAIGHYIDIFRTPGSVFSHGDYSIDNILFRGDDVTWVLDWENFNDKLPVQFDPFYCVIEACFFSYKKHTLDKDAVKTTIGLLEYAADRLNMPYDKIIKAPCGYMYNLFIENKTFFGAQIMKYPLMNCRREDISNIDNLFGGKAAR